MRIIGEIAHPVLKITVFKMENRFSVKLENGLYEQIYKFRMGDGLESLEDITRLIDAEFIYRVETMFTTMHAFKNEAYARNFSVEEEKWEEII